MYKRQKGLSIGWSASLGAALALAFGVIHLSDIPAVSYTHLEVIGTGHQILDVQIAAFFHQQGFIGVRCV